ncbi:S66 peptidase family protein [Geofilum sp. OHC36d9]|uniref:S66 peptidase family protein n=1 Tax=Geofilum sp. OHC36d9 TaxID=3458413 RepID=UPI00403389EB
MISPSFLSSDDLVGIVSPAGKIAPSSLKLASQYLENMGLRCLLGKHAAGQWHQMAGTDQQRADDFNAMLKNPEVKAIWCSRGGYGAIRLVNRIDFSLLKNQPKWIIGFSDITVFHSVLGAQLKMKSVHGPMPKNLETGNYDSSGVDTLWQMLQGNEVIYQIMPHSLNVIGEGRGKLIGGNLTLLNSLVGTPYDFEPEGKILFIEEVGEYLYHIDRMLRGLKLAGKLKGLAGLVVGQMTDIQDNHTPFGASPYEIISQVVEGCDFPVMFNFPAGHSLANQPLMLGATVHLSVKKETVTLNYIK